MRASLAIGFLSVLGIVSSFSHAAPYVPPSGFTKTADTFLGGDQFDTNAFAVAPDGKVAVATGNFGGGADIKVYSSAAAAHTNTGLLRTFTDPTYKAWGDLTFTDNDTLLFSENGDKDTVYRGQITSGSTTMLAPVGS